MFCHYHGRYRRSTIEFETVRRHGRRCTMGNTKTMVDISWKKILPSNATHGSPIIMRYKRHLYTNDMLFLKTMSSVDVHALKASLEPHGSRRKWKGISSTRIAICITRSSAECRG